MSLPGFTGLKATVAPYLWALKLAVVVVAFLGGIAVGCSQQSKRDQHKIDAEVSRTAEANALAEHNRVQGQVLADQLNAITARTRAAQAAAEARVKAARAQADAAAKETEAARKRVTKVEADLAKAKRDPDCKRLLETKSCAAFR